MVQSALQSKGSEVVCAAVVVGGCGTVVVGGGAAAVVVGATVGQPIFLCRQHQTFVSSESDSA